MVPDRSLERSLETRDWLRQNSVLRFGKTGNVSDGANGKRSDAARWHKPSRALTGYFDPGLRRVWFGSLKLLTIVVYLSSLHSKSRCLPPTVHEYRMLLLSVPTLDFAGGFYTICIGSC
jgi:hypothetical protein